MELMRLAAACIGLSLAVILCDRIVGALLQADPAWRVSGDPRQRILWDPYYDGSSLVLIGDSAFCSYYVDRSDDTLWSRLSARSGLKVFPAALEAAPAKDVLLATKHIATTWPPGTTIFVGIHPLRVFDPRAVSVPPESRYASHFTLLVDVPDANGPFIEWLERSAGTQVAGRSFVVRNHRGIQAYLDGFLRTPQYFGRGENRNRRWDVDGDFAWKRFQGAQIALRTKLPDIVIPFSWIRSMEEVLRTRGMRTVFVLTPLNVALLKAFSDGRFPTEQILWSSHDYLVHELEAGRFEFVDLYRGVDSASFADLIHLNARGDDAVADALSRWLRQWTPAQNSGTREPGGRWSRQDH